jgi:hypothetical protein
VTACNKMAAVLQCFATVHLKCAQMHLASARCFLASAASASACLTSPLSPVSVLSPEGGTVAGCGPGATAASGPPAAEADTPSAACWALCAAAAGVVLGRDEALCEAAFSGADVPRCRKSAPVWLDGWLLLMLCDCMAVGNTDRSRPMPRRRNGEPGRGAI